MYKPGPVLGWLFGVCFKLRRTSGISSLADPARHHLARSPPCSCSRSAMRFSPGGLRGLRLPARMFLLKRRQWLGLWRQWAALACFAREAAPERASARRGQRHPTTEVNRIDGPEQSRESGAGIPPLIKWIRTATSGRIASTEFPGWIPESYRCRSMD